MRKTLMAAASAVALLAMPAMAQTTTQQPPADTTTPSTTAPATTAPSAAASGSTVPEGQQQLPESHILGSDLIGASVTNANGDSIGKTSDVLVDKTSKTVDAVVIDVGGFLGIGSKSVAIPLDKLTVGERPDEGVKTAMTKEQLEALPAFEGRKAEEPAAPATGTMGGSGTTGSTTSGSGN